MRKHVQGENKAMRTESISESTAEGAVKANEIKY